MGKKMTPYQAAGIVAKKLGRTINPQQVYGAVQNGKIPHIISPEGKKWVDVDDVEKYFTKTVRSRQNVAAERDQLLAQIAQLRGEGNLVSIGGEPRIAKFKKFEGFNEQRKFGVEIEFTGFKDLDAIDRLIDNLNRSAIKTARGKYSQFSSDTWLVKKDSSCGWELVTPPLMGSRSFEILNRAIKVIVQSGGKIDGKCAVHVHHDMHEGNLDQFKKLVITYARYEAAIDSLVARSRRGTRAEYARSMAIKSPAQVQQAETMGQLIDLFSAHIMMRNSAGVMERQLDKRRNKVNFAKFAKSGTVEFRQHQASLNGKKIWLWVRFTQALVEFAMSSRVSNGMKKDFTAMAMALGLAEDLNVALRERAKELA